MAIASWPGGGAHVHCAYLIISLLPSLGHVYCLKRWGLSLEGYGAYVLEGDKFMSEIY